jgi:hypothetical protein
MIALGINKSYVYKKLLLLFFLLAIIEIVSEFLENKLWIAISKPILLPLLLSLYLIRSSKVSSVYIFALFLNWISNVLFLSEAINYVTAASVLFIISRLFILLKVYKEVKLPTLFPFVIGTIPFIFMFIYLNFLIFEEISFQVFIITIFHSISMSFMGGIALGNYIMKNDKTSKLLLVSAIFYTFNILILGVKFYYLDLPFLKPMSMVFFILGHFSLLNFMILSEKENFFIINQK